MSCAIGWASPAVATSPTLEALSPTVTATTNLKESALWIHLVNTSGHAIYVTSVTTTGARMSMLYYDANMCQGNNKMTWLANIEVSAHSSQILGYQYQGVMFSALRHPFRVGQAVPLTITWLDTAVHTSHVVAKVVAPPKGLHFLMSPMKM